MKFYIETIGCQQNVYDSSRLSIFLKASEVGNYQHELYKKFLKMRLINQASKNKRLFIRFGTVLQLIC